MNSMRICRTALAGFAAMYFACAAKADTTIYVAKGGDGTDPTSGDLTKAFPHPQDAIDAASGTSVTTIRIATGTYTYKDVSQNSAVLNVNKNSVTIEASDGYGTVVIDGGTANGTGTYNRRALTVPSTAEDVTVRNIIFKNGTASASNGATCAVVNGGILENCDITGYQANKASTVTIAGTAVLRNCKLSMAKDMSLSSSAASTLLVISGTAVLEDCTIGDIGLQIANLGKLHRPFAVYGQATFTRCTIRNIMYGGVAGTLGEGWGTGDGSVYAEGGTFADCVFTNNFAIGNGGGLYVNGAATVNRCRFRDNRATGRKNDLYLAVNTATVTDTASEDLDGANGTLGAWPDKEQDGARYAIVASNGVKAVRAGVEVAVRLDATSDVTPTGYDWTFEDETKATGRTVNHTFATAGEQTVTCVVTLSGGSSVTVVKKVLVLGPVCYVSKSGSNEAPYDTPEKAARHPQDAIDLRPAKVEIDTGKYGLRGAQEVSVLSVSYGDIEIVAKNGRGSVWIDGGKSEPNNGNLSRAICVGDGIENVYVRDLCLTNGFAAYQSYVLYGTILAYAGWFDNCSINLSGFSRNGGGAVTKNAVLTNCLITSVSPYTATGSSHDVGLFVSDGAKLINCEICDYKWAEGRTFDTPCIEMSGSASVIRGCVFHDIVIGKSGSTLRGAALRASGGTVENCTITGCTSYDVAGGLYISDPSVVCRNNIIYGNTGKNGSADIGTSSDYSMVTYTLASDLTTSKDTGNLSSASRLFKAGSYELDKDSQCVNAGLNQAWMENAKDRNGNPRIFDSKVDMGAYECQEKSVSLVADFSVSSAASFGPPPLNVQVTANVAGGGTGATYAWDWGDGTYLEMNATNGVVSHTYTTVGGYTIKMTVAKGGLTTVYALTNVVSAVGEVCYVSTNGAAIPPYDTWAKATSNIQDAVAYKPKAVIASNGVFKVSFADDDYGIVLDYPVSLSSVNGAGNTVIRGDFARPWGSESTRARSLLRMSHDQASVDGFTFMCTCPPAIIASAGRFVNNVATNFYPTYDSYSYVSFEGSVGVTNCVFDGQSMEIGFLNWTGCFVSLGGNASMDRCVIRRVNLGGSRWNNQAHRGVVVGGSATLRNSLIDGMTFENSYSTAPISDQNWLVAAYGGSVENCTIRGANVYGSRTGNGAGLYAAAGAQIVNVISISNRLATASTDGFNDLAGGSDVFQNNLIGAGTLPAKARNCLPVGTDPMFLDDGSGYRLSPNSPCRNAGKRLDWCRWKGMATDLDGQERRRGRPDIGCWEYQADAGTMLLLR